MWTYKRFLSTLQCAYRKKKNKSRVDFMAKIDPVVMNVPDVLMHSRRECRHNYDRSLHPFMWKWGYMIKILSVHTWTIQAESCVFSLSLQRHNWNWHIWIVLKLLHKIYTFKNRCYLNISKGFKIIFHHYPMKIYLYKNTIQKHIRDCDIAKTPKWNQIN